MQSKKCIIKLLSLSVFFIDACLVRNIKLILNHSFRYRRYPDHHKYLGEVYSHKGDIQDMDLSPYDECILLNLFFKCRFIIMLIITILDHHQDR